MPQPRHNALQCLSTLIEALPGQWPTSPGLGARTDDAGDLVILEQQDHSRWDQRLIALGFHYFNRSIAGDRVSLYHAQAAIAAAHARGARWIEILDLYEQLYALSPSPVVALNRAVAISKVNGPADALAAIDSLNLPGYHLYLAVRGHLLLELGARAEAAACFAAALECRCSEPEKRFLQRKIGECGQGAGVAGGLPSALT
jgi:RNA polymerase sigma-70 factor (ECF subfamily)